MRGDGGFRHLTDPPLERKTDKCGAGDARALVRAGQEIQIISLIERLGVRFVDDSGISAVAGRKSVTANGQALSTFVCVILDKLSKVIHRVASCFLVLTILNSRH